MAQGTRTHNPRTYKRASGRPLLLCAHMSNGRIQGTKSQQSGVVPWPANLGVECDVTVKAPGLGFRTRLRFSLFVSSGRKEALSANGLPVLPAASLVRIV